MRSSCKAAHSERRAVLCRHAGRLQLAQLGLPQCLHGHIIGFKSCIGRALCRTGTKQSTDQKQCRTPQMHCSTTIPQGRRHAEPVVSVHGQR